MSWKYKKISECAEVVGGGTPSTKKNEYWQGDIPWISPRDLSKNSSKYITHGDRNISKEGLENSSAKILPSNSLLFSSRAPIGYLAINKKPVATNQGFKSLILKEEHDVEYFYYLFKDRTNYIKSYASGSTFQEVSGSIIKNLKFLIPSFEEQRDISNVLLKFDKKIELNQKMIKTFEEKTKTLFKSWFIDFDPVRAKVEKRSTRLSKELSDLFSNQWIDTEIGKIPKGWMILKVKDVVIRQKIQKLYNNKIVKKNGEIQVIDQSVDGVIGFHSNKDYVSATINDPVFTFANHTCNMRVMFENFSVIQNVIPMRSNLYPTLWVYMRTLGIKKFEEYKGHIPDFMNTKLCFPKKSIAHSFEKIVRPMFKKIYYMKKENNILSKIRDMLLPKLINNKISFR